MEPLFIDQSFFHQYLSVVNSSTMKKRLEIKNFDFREIVLIYHSQCRKDHHQSSDSTHLSSG